MRQDVAFSSEGADLRGWVYVPDSEPPWPLVVMANGFSATRHMTADKYAEIFHAAGLAVLLYDHRGFGDSGGEPVCSSTHGSRLVATAMPFRMQEALKGWIRAGLRSGATA